MGKNGIREKNVKNTKSRKRLRGKKWTTKECIGEKDEERDYGNKRERKRKHEGER